MEDKIKINMMCHACGTSYIQGERHCCAPLRDPLLVEREKVHGDFKTNAYASQALKNALRDWNTAGIKAPQFEALEMICLKMARILQNPNNKDSWKDIAGYANLGAEACDE